MVYMQLSMDSYACAVLRYSVARQAQEEAIQAQEAETAAGRAEAARWSRILYAFHSALMEAYHNDAEEGIASKKCMLYKPVLQE